MINKIIDKMEFLFKILLLLYTMIGYNGLLNGNIIISYIMWPMFVLGAVIILWKTINIKCYIKTSGFFGMILFIISFITSMLINYRYELKQNIISLILIIFYFGILYLHDYMKDKKKLEKEMAFFSIFFLVYMMISVLVSLGMLLMKYRQVYYVGSDSYEVVVGFVWGRLWGVFLDPNVGALLACIAVVIAWGWICKAKNVIWKVVCSLCIFFQVLYITFSDSRTGMLCFACLAAMKVYCSQFRKFKANKNRKNTQVFLIVVECVVIAVLAFMIPQTIKYSYNHITIVLNESNGIVNNETEDNNKSEELLIERGYELEEDPSNRRFDIWKSGIEIFKDNPIIGTSYNGIRPYAYEHLPQTYIINNDSVNFRNLHNEFLNILVAQGIVGVVALLMMIIPLIKKVLFNLFKCEDEHIVDYLFCGVGIITVGVMFTSAGMFYYVCPFTVVFWMMLGYLEYYLQQVDNE